MQLPLPSHASPTVQTLLSALHAVPDAFGVFTHPVAGEHEAVQHWPSGVHESGAPDWQTPVPEHVSPTVQAFPSSHA